MAASPVLPKLVGQRVKRREDPRLIQGRGTYVDDIALVGMQHLAFKRSDVAHGRIRSIDTSAAEAMEGVEAVFTGAADRRIPGADADRHAVSFARPSRGRRGHRPLRRRAGRGRRGERSVHRARRRRRHRRVLRHAAGRRRSRAGDDREAGGHSSRLSEQPRGGAGAERHRRAAPPAPSTTPRSTTAFAKAEVVISQRMVNQRLAPSAMEPRGVVAHYEPGKGTMTIWSSTQNPHILRIVHRRDDRARPGSGPGHRAGSGRRFRRQDQHLRRRVRRGRDLEASRHSGEVGRKTARKRSSPRLTAATSSATWTSRRSATAPCSV